jgi:hypothetical protein
MRTFVMSVAAVMVSACATQTRPTAPAVTQADLARVVGEGWTGTLVYRDYSPPFGSVTLDAEVDISQSQDGLILAIRYPREPSANSTDVLSVSADGTMLGGDPVVARREEGRTVYITTRAPCEDDDKPAICEHTYTFGEAEFGTLKRVTFASGGAPVQRNAYSFTR